LLKNSLTDRIVIRDWQLNIEAELVLRGRALIRP